MSSIEIMIWSRVRRCAKVVVLANTPRSVVRSLPVIVHVHQQHSLCQHVQQTLTVYFTTTSSTFSGMRLKRPKCACRNKILPHPLAPALFPQLFNLVLEIIETPLQTRSATKHFAAFPTGRSHMEIFVPCSRAR